MYTTSYRHFRDHRRECFDAAHDRLVTFQCRVCAESIVVSQQNYQSTIRAEGRCVGCVLDGKPLPAPTVSDVLDWALAGLGPVENPEVRQQYARIVIDLAMGYQRGTGTIRETRDAMAATPGLFAADVVTVLDTTLGDGETR